MDKIQFNTQFIDQFLVDPDNTNISREVNGFLYSYVNPYPFKNNQIIHLNRELIKELGWSGVNGIDELIMGKNLENIRPYAMNYGGHQFGNWAGQLGDGRAMTLFECDTIYDIQAIQIKGGGPTPYSRGGDGFAVLRSSIREYLMSEAMYHLGIPTTRALAMSITGNTVTRDRYYTGDSSDELGAIVTRMADSFIRFGTFELLVSRKDIELLQSLADYTIETYFADINSTGGDRYVDWFEKIVSKTLTTLIEWERVGFVHGVLNTDNMSILGLTLDYGPYGMMEQYDPFWTPNMSDYDARYSYGNQPRIALWNLHRLSIAIRSLTDNSSKIQKILSDFQSQYTSQSHEMMCQKLGFLMRKIEDASIIHELKNLLHATRIDMTLFFRGLSEMVMIPGQDISEFLEKIIYHPLSHSQIGEWNNWIQKYLNRINEENMSPGAHTDSMNQINPKYILRNWMLNEAIEQAENGDYNLIEEFYQMIQYPYLDNPKYDKWYTKNPYPNNQSKLSCSS